MNATIYIIAFTRTRLQLILKPSC